jgi:flagellar L-ring protein precursor FlgH
LVGSLLTGGCASELVQPTPGDDPAFVATRPVSPPLEVRRPRSALPSSSGSLFRAGYGMHLFEDTVARRVGDILTITLLEKTDAKKKAGTDIGKNSSGTASAAVGSSGLSTPSNAELEVSAERDFEGTGKSEQSNSLKGNITVVVAEVLPNGNLVVGGETGMTPNQGKEYIRISGIVRPQDIAPDNTVSSLLVADARISYGGTGAIGDANKPGWLTRFFISPFFPF